MPHDIIIIPQANKLPTPMPYGPSAPINNPLENFATIVTNVPTDNNIGTSACVKSRYSFVLWIMLGKFDSKITRALPPTNAWQNQ